MFILQQINLIVALRSYSCNEMKLNHILLLSQGEMESKKTQEQRLHVIDSST